MTAIFLTSHAERLGWILVHSLWQFLAIALIVRLFERVFTGRSGAKPRYAAGVCGLAAITAAPVATWYFFAAEPMASTLSQPVALNERDEPRRATSLGPPAAASNRLAPVSNRAFEGSGIRQPSRNAWSAASHTLTRRLRPWLPIVVGCWLTGLSLCSLRPLVGWFALRRLRARGLSAAGQAVEESAQRIARRLGLSRAVRVLRSAIATTPLVAGYLRPMLLMPVAMLAELSPMEVEAILAHELAHVRRHDFLVNLWQTLLETVFYYHPAVWSLSRRLRAEREYCCDDLALSLVGDPVCYGRALLHVEELRGAESLFAFGAGGSPLRVRILRLFGQPSPPTGAAGLFTGVVLSSVAIAGFLAAFAWAAPPVTNDESRKPAAEKAVAENNAKAATADEMPAAAIIRGVLLNATDGKPVAGAQIILSGREKRDRSQSDAAGRFEFVDVPPDPREYETWAYSGNLVTNAIKVEQAISADGASARFAPLQLKMHEGKQVKFLVTSAATGKPLRGAKIEFGFPDRRETATGAVGTALVEGLLTRSYEVTITAPGHAQQTLTVNLAQQQRLTELRIELAPGGIARGIAVDADGKPVAGAFVYFFLRPGYGTFGDTQRTDAQGRFQHSFVPLDTPIKISIQHSDFARQEKQIVVSHEGQEAAVQITLARRPHGKAIRGVVKDSRGNAVAGARVRNYGNTASVVRESVTKAKGEFSLNDLLETYAGYEIYVTANGFAPRRLNVEPGNADSPATVDITLEAGHAISGIVLSDDGTPLRGALVTPESTAYAHPNYGDSVRTDEAGRFVLDSLPADARIHVSASGHPHSTGLTLPLDGDEPVTITLAAPGELRGRVSDAKTGNPIRQFTIFSDSINSTTFNSADGGFIVKSLRREVPLSLTVRANGYEKKLIENVFAAKAGETNELSVELAPIDLSHRYSLNVQLLDFAGRPAAGAQLRLIVTTAKPIGKNDNNFNWVLIQLGQLNQKPYCDQFLSGVSNADGQFEFNDILPGKHLRLAYCGEGVPQGLSLDLPQSRADASDLTVIKLPEPAHVVGMINRERFPDAGSIQLSLHGEAFHGYQLKLAEGQTAFEFGDLPPGDYGASVCSKPVPFSENGTTMYHIHGLASQRIQLQPGETKKVFFNEPDEKNDAATALKAAPAAKPAAAARSLDIVIAKHVILWDGRIRSWDEVISELREISKANGEPIHPHFHFTNGAYAAGHFDRYKAQLWKVYRELFQPAGMSFGSISPRAGPRYDAIRKPQDLLPDPAKLRSGVVVEKGQPKAGVLVVLVPENGMLPVVLKPDLTLRDPYDEVWTVTDAAGRFTLDVEPVHVVDDDGEEKTKAPKYALAAISPAGYRLADIPAVAETATIELQPLGRLELTRVEGGKQRIELALRGGLPAASPGFLIYEVELDDKPLSLSLPAGEITVERSFRRADGASRSYPAETVQLETGESRQVTLPNVTEAEAERK